MITYVPNPIPPLLQSIAAGKTPDSGYASAVEQQKLQAAQQTMMNAARQILNSAPVEDREGLRNMIIEKLHF